MPWLDIAADIATIAASIAVIVTALFVWRQARLMAQDVDTDIRRFQRESLSAIHETLQDGRFRAAREEFFGGPHQRQYQDLTDQERRRARFILSNYALMTRMIGSGAVDEALYRDYWGATLARDWDRLENFVAGERLGSGNHGMFSATEQLVAKWGA